MPFAVELFLDPQTEAAIESIWRDLDQTGIAPYMYQSGNRPHITLAIYQQLDLAASEQELRMFAAARPRRPLVFQFLGVFPTTPATVFLGLTVSPALLELHAQLHARLSALSSEPYPYYMPGQWIPHCTLALELEPRLIGRALASALQFSLPLSGEMIELGVIEFRPVKHLFAFALGGL